MSTHRSHSNTQAHQNSLSDSGWSLKSHSVSIGSTSVTSLPNTLAGSLTQLNAAAAEARASLSNPNSTATVSTKPSNSAVQQILTNSGGSQRAKYQNGTLNLNYSWVTDPAKGQGTLQTNKRTLSNDENNPMENYSTHCNVTKGANINISTAPLQEPAQPQTSYPNGSITVTKGQKMTKSQANQILGIINKGKVIRSTVPSFGTRTISGTSHYNHSNS